MNFGSERWSTSGLRRRKNMTSAQGQSCHIAGRTAASDPRGQRRRGIGQLLTPGEVEAFYKIDKFCREIDAMARAFVLRLVGALVVAFGVGYLAGISRARRRAPPV